MSSTKQDTQFFAATFQNILSITGIFVGWIVNKYWTTYRAKCKRIEDAYMKIFMLTSLSLFSWVICIFTPYSRFIPFVCVGFFGLTRIPACLCLNSLLQISIAETGHPAQVFTIINFVKLAGVSLFVFTIQMIRTWTTSVTFMYLTTGLAITLGLWNLYILPGLMIPTLRTRSREVRK
jgi:hypothetical protein